MCEGSQPAEVREVDARRPDLASAGYTGLEKSSMNEQHSAGSSKPSNDALEVLKSLLMQCKPYVIQADRIGPDAHPRLLLSQINAALEHPAFRAAPETPATHRHQWIGGSDPEQQVCTGCDSTRATPEETNAARQDLAYFDGAKQAAAMAHQSLKALDDWIAGGCGGRWQAAKEERATKTALSCIFRSGCLDAGMCSREGRCCAPGICNAVSLECAQSTRNSVEAIRTSKKANPVMDSIAPNKHCPVCDRWLWVDKFDGHKCVPVPSTDMLPNDHHPGPRCSCGECLRRYAEQVSGCLCTCGAPGGCGMHP